MQKTVQKTQPEVLTPSQRGIELLSVIPMLLLFGFFVYHQAAQTGFFTARFGALEMFCLYGPILFSPIAPMVRAFNGRRNPARPFEIAMDLFLALTAIWLVVIFPFNFAHLADALPSALSFLLTWINSDIGKAILVIEIFVGLLAALPMTLTYLSVRRRELAHPTPLRAS